jgi:hypothetical protein
MKVANWSFCFHGRNTGSYLGVLGVWGVPGFATTFGIVGGTTGEEDREVRGERGLGGTESGSGAGIACWLR